MCVRHLRYLFLAVVPPPFKAPIATRGGDREAAKFVSPRGQGRQKGNFAKGVLGPNGAGDVVPILLASSVPARPGGKAEPCAEQQE